MVANSLLTASRSTGGNLRQDFLHTLKFLNLSIDSTIKEPPSFPPSPTQRTMPAPTTTLLIEGSFSELADEFAQYVDALRKEGSLQAEIAPLLEPLRQQEQSEGEPDLKQRDEVLKKLVGAAAALNGAPEKGELVDCESRPTLRKNTPKIKARYGHDFPHDTMTDWHFIRQRSFPLTTCSCT